MLIVIGAGYQPRMKQSWPTFDAVAVIVHLSQLDIFSDLDASDVQEGKTSKARLGASFSPSESILGSSYGVVTDPNSHIQFCSKSCGAEG